MKWASRHCTRLAFSLRARRRYNYEAVKIFMPANREKPVIVPYIEHVPPDVTAGIFGSRTEMRSTGVIHDGSSTCWASTSSVTGTLTVISLTPS
jgi:hypothetical protein